MQVRPLGQVEDDRWHRVEPGHPVPFEFGREAVPLVAVKAHDGGTEPQAVVHRHGHAVDVEEREHGGDDVVGLDALAGGGLQDVGDQVAVGQHDALGQPGRPARVRQRGEVPGRVAGHAEGRSGRAQPIEIALDPPHPNIPPLDALGRVADLVGMRVGREGELGPRVAQLMSDLRRRVERVQRGDDPARSENRVKDHGEIGLVGRHQRNDIALAEPLDGEGAG